MNTKVSRILFTQLPRLENDVEGKAENFPMASIYLNYALDRQRNDHHYERRFLTSEEEQLDDRHLLALILGWKPDVICSSLYLWNTSDHLPPYGVRSTATLSPQDILDIEEALSKKTLTDSMTQRFVGHRLPDLFEERIVFQMEGPEPDIRPQGSTARRVVIFHGNNLFQKRERILAAINAAIRSEPHILHQFVLNPQAEEPLDLLEAMITVVRSHGRIWLDRFAFVAGWDRLASRRVFVLLNRSGQYSKSRIQHAETLLQDHFY